MYLMYPSKEDLYDASFFSSQRKGSKRAAEIIAKRVACLVRPDSVIDVGCGVGAWARAFLHCGASHVRGVDGEWVNKNDLSIRPEYFTEADLSGDWHVSGAYDLAVCLEVAEHLPPEQSHTFVRKLCDLAPVVLFSAAIPGQQGVNHINERWQHEWVEIFNKVSDFTVVDILRWEFWMDDRIPIWYRQNMLLFVKDDVLSHYNELKRAQTSSVHHGCSVVHPILAYPRFQMAAETLEQKGVKILSKALGISLRNKVLRVSRGGTKS